MAATPDPTRPPKPENEAERSGSSAYQSESTPTFYSDLTPDPKENEREKKPQRWIIPLVATMCAVAALALGGLVYHPGQPPQSSEQVFTYSGADFDQAETQKVVDEIKVGAADPTLNQLTPQMKQELLSGERKFYKVPLNSTFAGASSAVTGQDQSVDLVSIAFNGTSYGRFTLSQQPITFDLPLRLGDQLSLTCLSVGPGRTTIQVALATALNPVESHPLAKGETQVLHVQKGGGGENYDWYQQQAAQGNVVAEYGLGHMYEYGVGVPQDFDQAIHWFKLAAAQNYLDAKAQLKLLSSP